MSTQQILNAVCKFAPKQVATRFGQKLNAVFVLDNGDEHTAWGLPSDENLALIVRGQKVQFLRENGKLKLLDLANKSVEFAEVTNDTASQEPQPDDFKSNVSRYIQLYAYCLEQVKDNINKELLDTESIRSIATSVFIQAMKGV